MQIRKVELKNFRNHSFCEINFKEGINLLLGENGSGKSSILEAIGLALYGTDLRSSIKDAIKKGEKASVIRIEFIDNQGKSFIVEKIIGSQNKQYLMSPDGSFRIENQNQVIQEIGKLTGIESNTKNIFQDVISAYQNQFTSIFSGTDGSRQETFNRIFKTDIYRAIFEGHSKSALDKYSIDKDYNKKLLENLKLKIKDDIVLNLELNELSNLYNQKDVHIKELSIKLRDFEIEKERLEGLRNKIEINKKSLNNTNDKINIITNQLSKIEEDIEQANRAEEVLKERIIEYQEFIELSKELKELTDEVNILEKLENDKIEYERQRAKFENDLTKAKTEKESLEKVIDEKQEEFSSKQEEIEVLEDLRNRNSNSIQKVNKQKEDLEASCLTLESRHKELIEINKTIEKFQIQLAEKEKYKVDFDQIEYNLNELSKIQVALIKKEAEKRNIEQGLSKIKERLRENASAYQKLSNGKCPYLQEECENIKKGASIEEFFKNRKKDLEVELKDLSNNYENYNNLDDEIKAIRDKITILEKNKIDGKLTLTEMDTLNHKIELLFKDKQIKVYEIKELSGLFSSAIADLINSEDFEAALDKVKGEISDYQNELSVLLASSKELKKSFDTTEKNKEDLGRIIKESNSKKKELVEKIDNFNKEIDKIRNEISDRINQTTELPEKKEMRNNLITRNEELKPSYDEYMKNEKKAKELSKYLKAKSEFESAIVKLNKEKDELKTELNQLEIEFSEYSLLATKQNIEQNQNKKNRAIEELAEIKNSKVNKQKEIEENRKLREELAILDESISLLEKKIVLTNEFRNNIKQMGKMVALHLMERIERLATENYRRISNNSENIRWVNDEGVSYKVFLCNSSEEQTHRAFDVLSGGEQVMVALSLRSAMASLLTKARFAIFDEPTINLDTERRTALADSFNEMLKNLQQAIIVTHDDTFSNMANHIIKL